MQPCDVDSTGLPHCLSYKHRRRHSLVVLDMQGIALTRSLSFPPLKRARYRRTHTIIQLSYNFPVIPVNLVFSPSVSYLPVHAPTTSSHSANSPLSPSITPSLSFTPASRPTSFANLSHHRLPSSLRTDSMDFTTGPFLLSISVFLFLVSSLLCFVWFRAAD